MPGRGAFGISKGWGGGVGARSAGIATGYGVRLLLEWLSRRASEAAAGVAAAPAGA